MKLAQHYRLRAILLLGLAMAVSGLGRAEAWFCDDGRPCVTGAPSCCPPERQAAACGATGPMTCCSMPAATACCALGEGDRSPSGETTLRREPGCHCSAAYTTRGAMAGRRPAEACAFVLAVAPPAPPLLVPEPERAPPRLSTHPVRRAPRPTPGGRAPPGSERFFAFA